MQGYILFLKSMGSFVPDVLAVVGSLVTICAAFAGLCKTAVAIFGWQGGRLDHAGNAFLGASVDLKKVQAGIAGAVSGSSVPTAVKVLAFVTLAPMLMRCAYLKPVEPQLIACEEHAVAQAAESLIPAAADALGNVKPGVDWSSQLDTLLLQQGAALVCAVEVVISEAEVQGTSAGAKPARFIVNASSSTDVGPPWLVCSRGHAWLQALHVRKGVVSR